jgi:hypothetical protein
MDVNKTIRDFVQLRNFLSEDESGSLQQNLKQAEVENPWFTPHSLKSAVEGLVHMLHPDKLKQWIGAYEPFNESPKNIGLILAGNIPMVGFHDLLAVLLAGKNAWIKPSSQDMVMMKLIVDLLREINSIYEFRIKIIDKVKGIDAVIATGSNNTSRYFEYYFKDVPHVIRKNRNSVAFLTGKETDQELRSLAEDVFLYFGMGCRNVSKLLVPSGYDFEPLKKAFLRFSDVMDFHKYANNYHYHKTVYLMNAIPFIDLENVLLQENEAISSPLSVCYFSYYNSVDEAKEALRINEAAIQVVVANASSIPEAIPFGKAQRPEPWDYADNFDTIRFLKAL